MPTLFVEADEPLLIFPSVEAAERYLEAIDVRGGVYPLAFGPSGEQYSIVALGDTVAITPLNDPPDADGLRSLLRRSLDAVGEQQSETSSLPELVAAAEAFWNERDPYGDRFSAPISKWGYLLVVVILVALVVFLRR